MDSSNALETKLRKSQRTVKKPIRFASAKDYRSLQDEENSSALNRRSSEESQEENETEAWGLLIRRTFDKIVKSQKKKMHFAGKNLWMKEKFSRKLETSIMMVEDARAKDLKFIPVEQIKIPESNDVSVLLLTSPDTKISRKKSPVLTKEIHQLMMTLPEVCAIPRFSDWTPLPYNVREDESTYLTNIPYLGDELIDRDSSYLQDVLEFYDWKFEEDNQGNKIDDETFIQFIDTIVSLEQEREQQNTEGNPINHDEGSHMSCSYKQFKLNLSQSSLETLIQEIPALGSEQHVIERFVAAMRYNILKAKESQGRLPILPNRMEQYHPSMYPVPNVDNEEHAKVLSAQTTMSAYRSLFCQRCYQYDCSRHTDEDNVPQKFRQVKDYLPGNKVLEVECNPETCYKSLAIKPCVDSTTVSDWTSGEISLFYCLIESFKNYCFVAKMMLSKNCQQVYEFATLKNITLTSTCGMPGNNGNNGRRKLSKKVSNWTNRRKLAKRWINNAKKMEKSKPDTRTSIEVGVIGEDSNAGEEYTTCDNNNDNRSGLPSAYKPCRHDEMTLECNSECSCRIRKTSCEKFCTCSSQCTNRFPGCLCTGTCDTKRCMCFSAARECDPDLCKGCGSFEIDLQKVRCQNVSIQRQKERHLLIGKSDVSGWGIFSKDVVSKGEFIAEYRGEIITPEESDKRGYVYDRLQHTYLFGLNKEYDIDAMRKGNKSRFINSSKNPNCEIRRMLVNGDHRIGIYARRNIEAGEELFYDYENTREKQRMIADRHASNMINTNQELKP